MKKNRPHEANLKAMILNDLLKPGRGDGHVVIINEFTLDDFSRRVDLAFVTNKDLIAFEVKSEADSLYRLEGQIEKYLSYFDKIIVVGAAKHVPKLLEKLPNNVEIWEPKQEGGFYVRRKGKKQKVPEKLRYLDLLKKNELESFSKILALPYRGKAKADIKKNLGAALQKKPIGYIKEFVLGKLRDRFQLTSNFFFNKVVDRGIVTSDDVVLLSPYAVQRDFQRKLRTNSLFMLNRLTKSQNDDPLLVELVAKSNGLIFGDVPESIKKVIKD